jgi:hypothetical protein
VIGYRGNEDTAMSYFASWFPFAVVGATFTVLGFVKLYGFLAGVVGGADKSFLTRLCGT